MVPARILALVAASVCIASGFPSSAVELGVEKRAPVEQNRLPLQIRVLGVLKLVQASEWPASHQDRAFHRIRCSFHSFRIPDPPLSQFSNKATDTHGYIARDDLKQEFIVAFRGSSNISKSKTFKNQKLVNLTGPGYPKWNGPFPPLVHKGFLAAYNSVSKGIQDTLRTQLAANNGSHAHYAIISVGHDLGGSLAALAGVTYRYVFFDNLVQTYTYGQPRTGDLNWAWLVDELMGFLTYRVVHTSDGVPKIIPGSDTGYVHHPVEYWNYRDPPSSNTTKQCVGTGEEFVDDDETCSITVKTHTVNAAHFKYFNIPYNKAFCKAV